MTMNGGGVRGHEIQAHRDAVQWVEENLPQIGLVADRLCASFASGGKLLTFGNGGSAADAQHLAAEFMGRFLRQRRPLPAVALTTDASIITCIANDYSYEEVFARQVAALAAAGDVVLGFTTSGNSPSVVRGLERARQNGALTVLVAAGVGGAAVEHADIALLVGATETARIQEAHLLILHLLSEQVDEWAFLSEERAS